MTPRSLGERAERALLGALLINPGNIATLPPLHRHNFAGQRHARVFAAITAGPSGELRRRAAAVTRPGVLSALRHSCPDETHAAAYARLVAQASRSQLAVVSSHSPEFDPYQIPQPPRRHPVFVRARTMAEENVLAAILQGSAEALLIPQWLPHAAFRPGPRRELYAAITRLHQRGDPIDEVTADWERAASGGTDDTGYASRLARRPVRIEDAVCYALLMTIRTDSKEEPCLQAR